MPDREFKAIDLTCHQAFPQKSRRAHPPAAYQRKRASINYAPPGSASQALEMSGACSTKPA
jgi:hypothetical protein